MQSEGREAVGKKQKTPNEVRAKKILEKNIKLFDFGFYFFKNSSLRPHWNSFIFFNYVAEGNLVTKKFLKIVQ